jgi:uncharacterized protein YdaU (DUF1376 family)
MKKTLCSSSKKRRKTMAKTHKPSWYIKWEPGAFLSSPDVALMTAEEVGQYCLLLNIQFKYPDCKLPNNLKVLAQLARVKKVSSKVLRKFEKTPDGFLRNARLYEDWLEASGRSEAAKKSASHRWEKGDANALRTECERNATSSNTSSSSSSSKTTTGGLGDSAPLQKQKSGENLGDGLDCPQGTSKTETDLVSRRTEPKERVAGAMGVSHIPNGFADRPDLPLLEPLYAVHGDLVNKVVEYALENHWKLPRASTIVKNWDELLKQYQSRKTNKRKPSREDDLKKQAERVSLKEEIERRHGL